MSRVYAFKNTDKTVMKSSSGGAFSAICYSLFESYESKACVYGAAFTSEMEISHIAAYSFKECRAFYGSKYVKSKCGSDVFSDIALKLKDNWHIVFSGTPCQIYALKQSLSKADVSTDTILFVDMICHGTPKVEVWKAYKKWLEGSNNGRLVKYSFRYKPEGWKAYPAYAEFDNGAKLINTAETSVFSRLHIKRYSIAKGCFNCPFSSRDRVSDITLGDFWGVERENTKINSKNGVSLVLANTTKGVNVIENIKKVSPQKGYSTVEIHSDNYLEYQQNLKTPTPMPDNYDQFWTDFNSLSFEKVLEKYIGYGTKYRIMFFIRKQIRKTPIIKYYRRVKKR